MPPFHSNCIFTQDNWSSSYHKNAIRDEWRPFIYLLTFFIIYPRFYINRENDYIFLIYPFFFIIWFFFYSSCRRLYFHNTTLINLWLKKKSKQNTVTVHYYFLITTYYIGIYRLVRSIRKSDISHQKSSLFYCYLAFNVLCVC